MQFEEMIERLGITRYPDYLRDIFNETSEIPDLSASAFDKIEEEFSVLGERIDSLKLCAAAVNENEALREFTRVAVAFLKRANHYEGFKLGLPQFEEDSHLYHYPIMLLALAVPNGIEKYRSRGFSEEEIRKIYAGFKSSICSKNNSKYGVTSYNWLRHYTSALLFNAGLFGVTPRMIDAPIIILKNNVGEYKIIVTEGKFHKSGKNFGSAGYSDEDGAYFADFSEDSEFYKAREIVDSVVSKSISTLRKSEWKIVAKQWDWMAALHIPRGADLSEDSMTRGFQNAMAKTLKYYSDLSPKFVHCSTWLLDPKLEELLGPNSNITRFINRFIKYPIPSGGKELFGSAFPSSFKSYEELPENTSLQRKVKALYLNGEFIHAHAGFVPDSDTWK